MSNIKKTEKIIFRDTKEMVELIDFFKKMFKFEERSDAIRHIIRHFLLEYLSEKKIFTREELISDYNNLKRKLFENNL